MIRIGIYGYGNLGKGVECAIHQNSDMELVGIFTRRNPEDIKTVFGARVYSADDVISFSDKIDVLILCGGSATDLPKDTARLAKYFNVVDSFDTHANIPEHFDEVNKVAIENNTLALISSGWDPGLFSINRLYMSSILPEGKTYTFWGRGVSQGHSDAIRRIEGVKNAIQYTIPKEDVINRIKNGERPTLSAREKHLRECFVVLNEGADEKKVEKEIKEMPNYFADYDTVVHFISEEELKKNHSRLPHGGFVLRSGDTTKENSHVLELSLKLDSNPEFTGSVLLAFSRAVYKMYKDGKRGTVTALDIPLSYLSPKSDEELRKSLV